MHSGGSRLQEENFVRTGMSVSNDFSIGREISRHKD
jgi:hypothetical protein